jgi:hypothetical protein
MTLNWGEFQTSVNRRTGASTSAPSITAARGRERGWINAAATSTATTTTPAFGSGPLSAAIGITAEMILYLLKRCPT